MDHQDLDSVEEAKKELRRQIEALEKDPTLADSPISVAVNLQFLKQSGDPKQMAIAELRRMLTSISLKVDAIYDRVLDFLGEGPELRARTISTEERMERIDRIRRETEKVLTRLGQISVEPEDQSRETIRKSLEKDKREE